jgi:hypothetical protein
VVLALALAAFFVAYMTGQDIFHFNKGPKPNALPKEANWMRAFRTAYQHPCWRSVRHHTRRYHPHLVAAATTSHRSPGALQASA